MAKPKSIEAMLHWPEEFCKSIFRPSATGKPLAMGGHYNLDLHISHVLKAYNIDTVIDVGANEGQFGAHLRKLSFPGDIYSFEPVKSTYDILAKTAADDERWETYNLALGEEAGQLQINVSESSDFSSLLDSNEFGSTRFKGIKQNRKENVTVCRLDEFIKEKANIGGKRIFLKIDAQGYDYRVFQGAKAILPSVCALVSELSLIPIYHGMKSYIEMLEVYQNSGFSVSGIYPVSRNKENLSLIEVDCVMVNQKLY